ncbi:MAG: stage II sporulation protein P [Oscillospiraceae bacterium]|nr:stage II sporulation protein P [Oscillospiraceae bacterium]
MKRKGHGRKLNIVPMIVVLTAAMALFWVLPAISPLILKAASVSAAFSMPEGVIYHVAERLKGEEPPPPTDNFEPPVSAAVITPPKQQKPAEDKKVEETHPDEQLYPEQPVETPADDSPEIPKQYKGEVLAEDLSDRAGRHAIIMDGFRLRNDTALPADDIEKKAETPFWIELEDTTEPQVLIYHTHATESYCPYDSGFYDTRYNWRSTDNNINMVAVGAVMAKVLSENGIAVLQDTSQHDYPSYNGSYANSYRSVKDYLEHYPTIKVVLDVHRDAIERSSGLIVKPTIEYEGQSYAQLMLVSNCDDGSGLLPDWHKNLSFAAAFSAKLESMVPGITRPILFSYRKYNQQLSNGALLMEFGSHANTLEEACRTAQIAGKALAELLNSNRKGK